MHIKLKACAIKFSLYARQITNFHGANVMKVRHLLISTSLLLGTTIGSTQTAYAGSDAFISEVFTMVAIFVRAGLRRLKVNYWRFLQTLHCFRY